MRLQQLNMLLVPFLSLILVGNFSSKAKGSLLPLIDSPNTLLSDLWSDRFPDPFRVFGVEKNEPSMSLSPARVD